MLAISVELLSGRYIATAYNNRSEVEWPPHPARLFSALVATWAEGEGEHRDAERAALLWLENQDAPDILADSLEVGRRSSVPVFVPVNDASEVGQIDRSKLDEAQSLLGETVDPKARAKAETLVAKLSAKYQESVAKAIAIPAKFGKDASAGLRLLPEKRLRQERRFPSATPTCPHFAFIWENSVAPSDVVLGLNSLLCRLIRLGHSSSMVRANLCENDQLATLRTSCQRYRPDENFGEEVIRWVSPGQLEKLIAAHAIHRETESRILPSRFVRYTSNSSEPDIHPPTSVFSNEFLVFERVSGPRLPCTSAVGVAKLFRRALQSQYPGEVPTILSGHAADGRQAQRDHLAIVPLPLTLGNYADGSILGLALVLPRDCTSDERMAVLRAIGRLEAKHNPVQLRLSPDLNLELKRNSWGESLQTLKSSTWCKPSRLWMTATPIALDRNPGDLYSRDYRKREAAFSEAENTIREAIRRIGLPSPAEVEALRSCALMGSAKPAAFPRFPSDKSRTQRVLVHARIIFQEPVQGPLLVGAGRYHGLGLCMPIHEKRHHELT